MDAVTAPEPASSATIRAKRAWLVIIAIWAVTSALVTFNAWSKPDGVPLFGDNAMRMVTASELLDGQGWQDLTEYRDNTPAGAMMHWSRLIDAPLAAMLAVLRPQVGHAAATEMAATTWPILLLLPLLALSVALVRRLVPNAGIVTPVGLALVSIVLVVEFLPGRTDHHNVQMLLSLAAAVVLLHARRTVWGAATTAVISATSLAIGLEALPLVAVTIAIYPLLWLGDPIRLRVPLVVFGITLGVATLTHFLAATPPPAYLSGACDMLSDAYVVPVVAGGLMLAAIAALAAGRALLPRLVLVAVGGAGTAALWAMLYPGCLAGPYAMEQLLSLPGYFELILEAQPLLAVLAENPANALVYSGAVAIAAMLTIWRILATRGERQADWFIVGAFLAISVAIMFMQLRGVRFAALFALPASAWLITRAREAYLGRPTLARAGGLVGSWLLLAGAAHFALLGALATLTPRMSYAAVAMAEVEAREACIARRTFAKLAALEPGPLMAPFNLGPNLLLFTPHSIVSAGFHRNVDGTRDVIDFFAGDEAQARRIADQRGIKYVAVCAGFEEYDGTVGPASGAHWDWLTPLSTAGEPLQVYAVTR